MDRFKYGFFCDDFSNTTLQETVNPQYMAAIENRCLVPNSFSWTVQQGNIGMITAPYCPEIVIT
jgi:hypothetical protein